MNLSISRPLALSFTALVLSLAPCRAEDSWKPAAPVKLEAVQKMLVELKEKEPATLRQPSMLAYKAALYLASGSSDTATLGASQKIEAKYTGGEETFTAAVVTVEFTGYADDSLTGERFTLHLRATEEGEWKITAVERAAGGRGDQK